MDLLSWLTTLWTDEKLHITFISRPDKDSLQLVQVTTKIVMEKSTFTSTARTISIVTKVAPFYTAFPGSFYTNQCKESIILS